MRLRKPSLIVGLGFLLSAVVGFTTVALGVGERSKLVPAAPGEPSYALSALRVTYPFVETTVEGEREDSSRAGVTFEIHWTSSTFPGEAECEITVTDQSGGTVGVERVNVESLTADAAPFEAPIPIAVTRVPAAATGVCAAATKPSADTDSWVISSTTIERPEEGAALIVGEIQWKGDRYPGTGICKATLSMADGATGSLEFTLDMPEGKSVLALLPPELTNAQSVTEVTCTPFASA